MKSFYFCVFLVAVAASLEVDDECTIPGLVEHGTAQSNSKKCHFVEKMLGQGNFREFRRYQLGFKGKIFFFCCPAKKSVSECKKFGKNPGLVMSSRIIGGTFAEVGEFPFFAALGYVHPEKQALHFMCGGVLISERFVLTAAHCIKLAETAIIVRLGRTALDEHNPDDENPKVDIDVIEHFIHENYTKSRTYNDIALLKLKHDVKFTRFIWPACLVPQVEIRYDKELTVAGFGYTDPKGKTQSEWLMKGSIQQIGTKGCNEMFQTEITKAGAIDDEDRFATIPGLPDGIIQSLMCAYSREEHIDTCQGDSGSGLMAQFNGTFYVLGVTSSGVSCQTRLPSFYTRVSSYIDWIEGIVWP